jgi:hypothetical protein
MIALAALTVLLTGPVTKLAPMDALEAVLASVVCVRAVPGHGPNKALVKEVLWGTLLRRGDEFTTSVGPPPQSGKPTFPSEGVFKDSIVFLKPPRRAHTWTADVYRINISRGTVDCSDYWLYGGSKWERKVLLLDGRLYFRKDVPRKRSSDMSVAEVTRELVRLGSGRR